MAAMSKHKPRCHEQVRSQHSFSSHQCERAATIKRNGHIWCYQHDPVALQARTEKRTEKWNKGMEKRRREHAALAACHGISTEALEAGVVAELLAAAKLAMDCLQSGLEWEEFNDRGIATEARDALRDAVGKAEGYVDRLSTTCSKPVETG